MRDTNRAHGATIKNNWGGTRHPISYMNIAGTLACQMESLIKPEERHGSRPPLKLVILGNGGGIVFECEVGQDGRVRHWGSVCRVRRSHFPATVFVTDRSLLTRTFVIEQATC
jgi:hypothetical protein